MVAQKTSLWKLELICYSSNQYINIYVSRGGRVSDGCGDTTALETIHFLSGSQYRWEILDVLVEHETMTRQEVRDAVSASRSTVRRTVEAFIERGLIDSIQGGYRLTATGRLLADGLDDLIQLAGLIETYEPFFRRLDTSDHGFDPTWLDGAAMTVATQTNPYQPAQEQTETVSEATTFRGFLPAIEIEGSRLVHEQITSGALTAEIVVPSTMLDTLRSPPFASLFRDQLATDRFDCWLADDTLPFYLGLPDEEGVEVGVDEEGVPQVLVQSAEPAFRAWGDETFDRYRTAANRLTREDL